MLINSSITFFIFSCITLFTAYLAIRARNAIYSVLFLILVFLENALILLTYEVEFLGFMLIIIYVGAIAILFLFVVMMLDIHYKKQTLDEKLSYLPFAVFIGIIFSVEIFAALSPFLKGLPDHNHYFDKIIDVNLLFPDFWPYNATGPMTYSYNIHHLRNPGEQIWITYLDEITNIETIGQLLYTYYGIFFLISGIILLIALLGAVSLTMQKREDSYQQQVYRQLSRNYKNAIFNIQSK